MIDEPRSRPSGLSLWFNCFDGQCNCWCFSWRFHGNGAFLVSAISVGRLRQSLWSIRLAPRILVEPFVVRTGQLHRRMMSVASLRLKMLHYNNIRVLDAPCSDRVRRLHWTHAAVEGMTGPPPIGASGLLNNLDNIHWHGDAVRDTQFPDSSRNRLYHYRMQ